MSTIINNPGDTNGDSSGVSIIFGVVLAVVFGGLFFLYILPMIRNEATPSSTITEIKVSIPETPAKPTTPAPPAGQ